jgi:hypothetical protein
MARCVFGQECRIPAGILENLARWNAVFPAATGTLQNKHRCKPLASASWLLKNSRTMAMHEHRATVALFQRIFSSPPSSEARQISRIASSCAAHLSSAYPS